MIRNGKPRLPADHTVVEHKHLERIEIVGHGNQHQPVLFEQRMSSGQNILRTANVLEHIVEIDDIEGLALADECVAHLYEISLAEFIGDVRIVLLDAVIGVVDAGDLVAARVEVAEDKSFAATDIN